MPISQSKATCLATPEQVRKTGRPLRSRTVDRTTVFPHPTSRGGGVSVCGSANGTGGSLPVRRTECFTL